MTHEQNVFNSRYRGPVESTKVLYETGRLVANIEQSAYVELLRQGILCNSYDVTNADYTKLRQRIAAISMQLQALISVLRDIASQYAAGGHLS